MNKPTASALTGLKLPFHFDRRLLQQNLALVQPHEWSPHYNDRDFGGQWRGAALRSLSGFPADLIATPAVAHPVFHDTPLLARCTYFRDTLARFECPLKSVRLLSLEPGSFIREHSDNALEFDEGEVRIHIPIETNPGVEFYLAGERLLLEEGSCYYVNVNLPHRVNNRGSSARIHLVIDAAVNSWVRTMFHEQSQPIERSSLPPGNIEEFRRVVLEDESLQDALRHIADRREFTARAIALGHERAFHFHESDMDAAFRAQPTPLPRAPHGWIPVKAVPPMAEWVYTGSGDFTEPFFEDTIRAALRSPFAALFRVAAPLPPPQTRNRPTGFIFHMSRCGSTLIARMLASMPGSRVISEAAPIDDILQSKLPLPERIEAFQSVVEALGQPSRYFLKFDAWHIHSLPVIRAAFPGTPWIFVYRDPLEVLVSHLRMPGRQTIPGAMDPAILGCSQADLTQLNRTQWCARVLGNLCRRALEFRDDPNALFIDYKQLPDVVTGAIANHFSLSLSPADESHMSEASLLNAKNPFASFEPDTQQKQAFAKDLPPDPDIALLASYYPRFAP